METQKKQKRTLEQKFFHHHQRKKSILGLVQYGGIRKIPAKEIKSSRYQFLHGDTVTHKLQVMLIFSTADRDALSEHLRVRSKTRDEGLTAIERIKDRPVVVSSEIRDAISAKKPADVEVLFRTGHVLRGQVVGMSKYCLMFSVNGNQLLAYIHGVHQIHVHGKATD